MSVTPGFDPNPGAPRENHAVGAIGRAQLARLFRLVVILQSERFPNARELAEQCEVCRRTTYRDLELLAAAGSRCSTVPNGRGISSPRGSLSGPPT
ncbi:MAG: hypothetical protein U0835_10580 [Isosphaeraceae bacterium]